jgi:hypothetical protein
LKNYTRKCTGSLCSLTIVCTKAGAFSSARRQRQTLRVSVCPAMHSGVTVNGAEIVSSSALNACRIAQTSICWVLHVGKVVQSTLWRTRLPVNVCSASMVVYTARKVIQRCVTSATTLSSCSPMIFQLILQLALVRVLVLRATEKTLQGRNVKKRGRIESYTSHCA